jgi:hypothetical protein
MAEINLVARYSYGKRHVKPRLANKGEALIGQLFATLRWLLRK